MAVECLAVTVTGKPLESSGPRVSTPGVRAVRRRAEGGCSGRRPGAQGRPDWRSQKGRDTIHFEGCVALDAGSEKTEVEGDGPVLCLSPWKAGAATSRGGGGRCSSETGSGEGPESSFGWVTLAAYRYASGGSDGCSLSLWGSAGLRCERGAVLLEQDEVTAES